MLQHADKRGKTISLCEILAQQPGSTQQLGLVPENRWREGMAMGILPSPSVSPENPLPGDWIHYDQNKNEQKRSAVGESRGRSAGVARSLPPSLAVVARGIGKK